MRQAGEGTKSGLDCRGFETERQRRSDGAGGVLRIVQTTQ
jgi:hypothetical protein